MLALVPFRQVRERGFAAHDDDAPIRCLVVHERESVAVDDAMRLLPRHPVVVDDLDVDVSDEEYAAIVRRVIDDEIGRGEGANFVIRREFTGSTDAAAGDGRARLAARAARARVGRLLDVRALHARGSPRRGRRPSGTSRRSTASSR